LGLSSAGGKAVFTNEWDRYAATTYSAWFGDENISTDDIRLLDPRTEIPDHDVLSAGFPCHLFLSYCRVPRVAIEALMKLLVSLKELHRKY